MVPFPILGREMVTREGELKGCTALTKCYVIGPIVRCQANLSGNPVISMYHKSPSGKRPTLLQPPPSPFLKGQKRHVIMSGYSYERVVFYIAIQFDHAHRMSTSAPSTFRPSPVSTTIRFEKCSKALLAKRSVHSPYFGLSFVPDLPLCSPIPPSNSAILHSLWPSLNDFVLDNHLQGRGYLKGLETMQKWTRGGGGAPDSQTCKFPFRTHPREQAEQGKHNVNEHVTIRRMALNVPGWCVVCSYPKLYSVQRKRSENDALNAMDQQPPLGNGPPLNSVHQGSYFYIQCFKVKKNIMVLWKQITIWI